MKSIQIVGPKDLRLVDIPMPTLKDGQVMIRSEFLSICGSDMRDYRPSFPEERYPLPAGAPSHECVGTVEESNSPLIKKGQRVIALSPGIPGTEAGHAGTGSEYFVTSPTRVISLPPGADPSTYIMCQPLGTVLYGIQRLGNLMGKTVAILGQGVIGLMFTQLISRMGASSIITIDHHDYRLRQSALHGATLTLNPYNEDVVQAVKDSTQGVGVDLVIEAAGHPETINQVAEIVRLYGTILLFGIPEEPILNLNYDKLIRKQATIIPSVSSSGSDPVQCIKDAVDLVAKGHIDVSWLITHRMSFSEAARAYAMYESYQDGIIKAVMHI